jgi:hypothetical protein
MFVVSSFVLFVPFCDSIPRSFSRCPAKPRHQAAGDHRPVGGRIDLGGQIVQRRGSVRPTQGDVDERRRWFELGVRPGARQP